MKQHSQSSSGPIGAGIKLAALVFALGAMALAADLVWMVPSHVSPDVSASALPGKSATVEGSGNPEPATSRATESKPRG